MRKVRLFKKQKLIRRKNRNKKKVKENVLTQELADAMVKKRSDDKRTLDEAMDMNVF